MALAEACRFGLGVPQQQAIALAVLELRAEKARAGEALSARTELLLERLGGKVTSYDVSKLGGDKDETDYGKRIQLVNTLQKKFKRGIAEEDAEYFTTLAACFYAALFGLGSLEMRATGIELLAKDIGEKAFGAALAEALRKTSAGCSP